MSIPLKLTVQKSGVTFEYTDVRLLQRELQIERRVEDLKIPLDSMELSVGRGDTRRSTFLGTGDLLKLPPRTRYRAKLTRPDTGELLLNGAIVTGDIEYDGKTQTWRAVLINQAAREFWDRLESEYFSDLALSFIANRSFLVWRRRDTDDAFQDGDPEFYKSSTRAYEVWNLIDAIPQHFGMSRDLPGTEFANSDGTFDEDDERFGPWITINRWRLSTCIKQLCSLLGWRISPTYQDFPSTDLHVEFFPTTFATEGLPRIDSDLDAESFTLRTSEPEWEALQYENDVAESSPTPLDYGIIDEASDDESFDTPFDFRTFATPPAWSMHGTPYWRADPPFAPSGSPQADSRNFRSEVEKLKIYLPPIDIQRDTVQGKAGRALLPDNFYSGFSTFDPDEGTAPQEDERAFLFATGGYSSDKDAYWPLWGDVDITHTGHVQGYHHIDRPFRQQRQRREVTRVLRGSFHTEADYTVGSRSGVSVIGEDWVVHEERNNLSRFEQQLKLHRPAERLSRVLPTIGDPLDWEVIRLQAKIVTVDRGSGKEDWLLAGWERTQTEWCREYKYQVTYQDESGTEQTTEVFATALTYQLASAGNGGQTYSGKDVEVIPVSDFETGGRETVTAEQ